MLEDSCVFCCSFPKPSLITLSTEASMSSGSHAVVLVSLVRKHFNLGGDFWRDLQIGDGAENNIGAGVTGRGSLLGLSVSNRGPKGRVASRLKLCIAEVMEEFCRPLILFDKGETGMGLEQNDGARASFLGMSRLLRCLNVVAVCDFENEGTLGLPLAMGACPYPSRLPVVARVLAVDTPLGIAVVSVLVVEAFSVIVCDSLALLLVVDLA